MPAILPPDFPAAELLRAEGHTPITGNDVVADATIAFINLMPNKIDTEVDFLRLINPSTRVINFRPVRMMTHVSQHTSREYLDRFYTSFDEIADIVDGVIITGAPLEDVPFEKVTYWREITEIMDRMHDRYIPMYNICWGAFASMYHWWGIDMHRRPTKLSGVFSNEITDPSSPIIRGVEDGFSVPFSRFVTWNDFEVESNEATRIVARGGRQGAYIVASRTHPEYYITGHAEYSSLTLHKEYVRDRGKGMNPSIPENYYPQDDPSLIPVSTWTETGVSIMSNWIEEVIRYKKLREK